MFTKTSNLYEVSETKYTFISGRLPHSFDSSAVFSPSQYVLTSVQGSSSLHGGHLPAYYQEPQANHHVHHHR